MFLKAVWRAFVVFENPFTIIWSYVVRRSPRSRMVRLRNGHVIHLSSDPADIITVFLIFAREDYGAVVPDTCVVDIGANIGVFALFAAFCGAGCVSAFEPSAASYEVLLRNIGANGLDQIVKAERLAAVGVPSAPVKFPRNSYVMNTILPESSSSEDYELVPTMTLSGMVSSLNSIDLVKSDCEGAEYEVLLHANETDIMKISEIRMEYHRGPWEELIAKLISHGFSVRQFLSAGKSGGGYLWLKRKSSV